MIYGMCKYTPVELFAGFSEKYERLESLVDSFPAAESLGHANLCGFGKGILEAAMRDEVKEVVLVNCCDVVRRVYEILKKNANLDFIWMIDLPHKNGRAEQWLMTAQLRKLLDVYAAYSGKTFDLEKAWRTLIRQKRIHDERDGQLEKMRNDRQDILATSEKRPYISLQGAHSGVFLPQMIRSRFSIPVEDDTCSGNRRLTGKFPEPSGVDEFLDYYAKALLSQTPCMRMLDRSGREELGKDARGVIFHTMKFCDYYGFEYADKIVDQKQPVLKIETDGTRQSEGQLATRLDAFAESLQLTAGRKKEIKVGRYAAGVDSGSASTDVVIMDRDRKIVSWTVVRTGAGAAHGAEKALNTALEKAGIDRSEIGEIVSTGYGRDTIGLGDESVTEITCHAKGAHYLDPEVRTIIDIGGQDSKAIRVDENGAVQSFVMNDKCAAGTGRFLEMMARTMEISMEEMSALGMQWKNEVQISSMCTVFAESEVVSLIAGNTPAPDIIHGLNMSVAAKTAGLVRRVHGTGAYMMTGGVAKNPGVVDCLSKKIGEPVRVSEYAQICGAIGAALFALEGSKAPEPVR